jgi:hypothetical protein
MIDIEVSEGLLEVLPCKTFLDLEPCHDELSQINIT